MSELHEAASTGDLLRLEDALRRGLSPNEPDADWAGRTPLHIACAAGHKKCVFVLLKEGADPNAVTEYGWTAAHFACEGGEIHNSNRLDHVYVTYILLRYYNIDVHASSH